MNSRLVLSSILSFLLVGMVSIYASEKKLEDSAHYDVNVIPKKMTIQEKKKRFFALIVPAVDTVYKELEKQYLETKKLIETNPKDKKLQQLMKRYYAKDFYDLLSRIKPHPRSIALAQAAVESAWATSNFFKIANNLFGVWSVHKDEPRVAAGRKRGNRSIYVKKYATVVDSIRDYYRILATNKVYQHFRDEKMKLSDPYKLVKYLDRYSEKRELYTKSLASVMRHNNLTKYDK